VWVADVVRDSGFRDGIAAGSVAFVALVAIALLVRCSPRRRRAIPALAGFALVAAGLVALDWSGPRSLLTDRLVGGLVLMGLGPALAAILLPPRPMARVVAALAAVPGAVVVAQAAALYNRFDWIEPFVVVTAVVGGALVRDFDVANARVGLAPLLVAVSALGIYSTSPDTEQILVVVGVAVPVVFAGWPKVLAAIGPGAYALTGLIAWAGAVGGRGRPGAVVGALGCLGIFLVEPVVRRAWRGRARRPDGWSSLVRLLVVTIHVAGVLLVARVAGLEQSATRAVVLAGGALALAAAFLALVLRPPSGSDADDQRPLAGTRSRRPL
jgi:hypothetical protein